MRLRACFGMAATLAAVFVPAALGAGPVLSPADAIIAIDFDPVVSNSGYPEAEAPGFAIDGTLSKYLNVTGAGAGFIVTPSLGAASVAESIQLTTANDAEDRDPSSYELWGTNEAIVSADNSTGLGENWSLISSGALSLPSARETVGDLIPLTNTDAYSSYKFVFPTNKGSNLFQIAEVEIVGDVPSLSLFDSELLVDGDPTLAIQVGPDSRYPGAEGPATLLDGDTSTKYLNFGMANSGFIVTPAMGASVVNNFQITTANDAVERDPTSYAIYGTNEAILSEVNSQGDGEMWTLIDSGAIALPEEREVAGPIVEFANDTSYTSYRVVFPTLLDESIANSMQISGFQFNAVPEPTAALLAAVSAATLLGRTRRRS